MITASSLMSLAPLGRRATTGAVSAFMRGGTGVGALRGGDGGLGILPLIGAAVSAAGSAAGGYFAADAAKATAKSQTEIAQAAADAAAAPYRYEFKTAKAQVPLQSLALTLEAVGGQMTYRPTDSSNTWLYVGMGAVVLVGAVLLLKGV